MMHKRCGGDMDFCLSQDLGRMGDYHGQILTETRIKVRGRTEMARSWDDEAHQDVIYPEIVVKWINRNQLTYDKLIDDTILRLQKPQIFENCWHIVDATGVGLPTIDYMRRQGLNPLGIWISSGASPKPTDYGYSVPKLELINALQLALTSGMVKFAKGLDADMVKQLLHEFQTFKDKRAEGKGLEAWREKDHDDLVLSLAMNVWWVLKSAGINLVQKRKYQTSKDYQTNMIFNM